MRDALRVVLVSKLLRRDRRAKVVRALSGRESLGQWCGAEWGIVVVARKLSRGRQDGRFARAVGERRERGRVQQGEGELALGALRLFAQSRDIGRRQAGCELELENAIEEGRLVLA